MSTATPGRTDLGLYGKVQTYGLLAGVVLGMIAVGLVIPFAFGEPLEEQQRATPSVEFGDEGGAATESTGSADVSPDEIGEDEASGEADESASPDGTGEGPAASGDAADGPQDAGSAEPSAGGGGPAEPEVAEASDEQLSATDRGVTAESVKVGFLLLDLAQAAQYGFDVVVGVEAQRRAYETFVEHVNDQGGIRGRTIEPVFASYDPLDHDTTRAACRELTEDEEVFAVISFALLSESALCFTEEHDTPLINSVGQYDEFYERSDGLYFSHGQSWSRSARITVAQLDRDGVFDGRTIGVIASTDNNYDLGADEGFIPALDRAGHDVKRYEKLSSDPAGWSSEIPLLVQQMQQDGVDLIVTAMNIIAAPQFAQQADSQQYRPLYVMSELAGGSGNGYLADMPESLEAVGITTTRANDWRVDIPEPEFEARCREIYQERTGADVPREEEGEDHTVYGPCTQVLSLFLRGADAAGVDLTRRRLSEGLQSLGAVSVANAGPGSLQEGKFDAADDVRPVRADMDCRCWLPVGGYRAPGQ